MTQLKNMKIFIDINNKRKYNSKSGLAEPTQEPAVMPMKEKIATSKDYYTENFNPNNVSDTKLVLDKRKKKLVAPNRSFEIPVEFELYSSNDDGTNFNRVVMTAKFMGLERSLSRYLDNNEVKERTKILPNLEASYNYFIRTTTQEIGKLLRNLNKNDKNTKDFYVELR